MSQVRHSRTMASGVKILAAGCVTFLLLSAAAVLGGLRWVKQREAEVRRELASALSEGQAYGAGQEQQGCQREALRRIEACKGLVLCENKAKAFLKGCLGPAQPTPGLCAGAPPVGPYGGPVLDWAKKSCGVPGPELNACTSLMEELAALCATLPGRSAEDGMLYRLFAWEPGIANAANAEFRSLDAAARSRLAAQIAPKFESRWAQERQSAAVALGSAGTDAAVSPLIATMRSDADNIVRCIAAASLNNALVVGGATRLEEGAAALLAMTEEREGQLRGCAASALAQLPYTMTRARLVALLRDPSAYVRASAASSRRRSAGFAPDPRGGRAHVSRGAGGHLSSTRRSLSAVGYAGTVPR